MKLTTLSVFAMVTALAAGQAYAADVPPPHGRGGPGGSPPHEGMFKKIDTNSDGSISKAEWQAKGDTMFKEIDADHDGKITPEEMKAHHDQMREKYKERRAEHEGKPGHDAPPPPKPDSK